MIDNKRIAKNTLLLYLRMLLLMGISLYTSRIVLHTLGVEDFGIYNVVGGVIVLFGFINNALTTATRRFINFNLGKNDLFESQRVFSASLMIHFFICLLIFVLGESVGLWFLNTQLNIEPERMYAANWVYQFSILSTCIGIAGAPFESVIVAYERMSLYAYISIAEGVFKLLIVYLLVHFSFDKLILYSILIFVVGILISGYKFIYCTRNFLICRFVRDIDKTIFRSFAAFSGWSLLGQIAYIGSTTGINMVVNIFFGVVLNAAIGIAQQVNGAIYNFVANFQTAFNPQLIQTYSSGNLIAHRTLISRASRISYYLLFLLSFPVLLNTKFILQLWLTDVPEKTAIFTQLIIIYSLIEALGTPLWMSMQAIGRIRIYQIIVSSMNILILPVAFVCLYFDMVVESIFFVKILIVLCLYLFRIFYILPKINYPYRDYWRNVLSPIVLFTTLQVIVAYLAHLYFPLDNGIVSFMKTCPLLLLCVILIFLVGMNMQERKYIYQFIKMKFLK